MGKTQEILAFFLEGCDFIAYLDALWHSGRLAYADDKKFSIKAIADCKHVEDIFKDTRVLQKDPNFLPGACRRTHDAVSNHPILVVGQWRQGKSSMVNSLLYEARGNGFTPARTGRRSRITSKVDIFGPLDDDEVGSIWLVDTPGLEPDENHDIMGGLRAELEKKQIHHVFTDIVVLAIASTPQGVSSLSSQNVMKWIKETYAKARACSSVSCTILPVLTHGDLIDKDEQSGDIDCVKQKLTEMAAEAPRNVAACETQAVILDPFIITNYKFGDTGVVKGGENIKLLLSKICKHVRDRSGTAEFRLQWSNLLTKDLQSMVEKFHSEHPDEETERRLFHRTLQSILATYGKRGSNIEVAFPGPMWSLLGKIESELRGEQTWGEKKIKQAVGFLPCAPSKFAPMVPLGVVLGGLCLWKPTIISTRIKALATWTTRKKGVPAGSHGSERAGRDGM